MKKLIITMLLLLSINAHAADGDWLNFKPLTAWQNVGEAVYDIEMLSDYQESTQVANYCNNRQKCSMHEINPMIGQHASNGKLRDYFIASGLIHYGVTLALPDAWRTPYQGVTIAAEGFILGKNAHLGFRVNY